MMDILVAFLAGALASLPAWILAIRARRGQRLALAQVEELRCGELVAFFDEELPPPRAEAFRGHLARCKVCERDLHELMQLEARLSTMPRSPR